MPEPSALIVFASAALLLLVTPGPAVLFVVTRSVEQGKRAGLISALGLTAGGAVHVVAAVAGLSALLASSAMAFQAVRWAGAIYLVYLGVRTILGNGGEEKVAERRRPRLGRLFREAMLVNALNPKAALFFLAFLPQFVDVEAGPTVPQILLLGGVFLALALVTDSIFALLAGALAGWPRPSRRSLWVSRWLPGSIYVAMGVGAAVAGRPAD